MKINTGQYELDLITATLSTKDNVKRSIIIDKITPAMFEQLNANRAWEAIRDLSSEGEIIDLQGVSGRMGGGDDFLWLCDVMSNSIAMPSNITGYAKRVRQSSYLLDARKRAIEALNVIDELSDITQVETVAGSIESLFDGLLLETDDKKPQRFRDVAKDYTQKLQDKVDGKADEHIILSNISDLDAHSGGFNRSDLIVVGGLSGSGKTEFSVKITRGIVKSGAGALVFSLEMSNQQVVERAISGEAMLPVSNLRNPDRLDHNNGWGRLSAGVKELIDTDLYMTDQTGLTVEQVVATATRHKRDFPNLDLIVVDHIGLMDLGKVTSRHDLQVGEISRRLKQLAKDLEVPVMLLTQLTGKKVMARSVMEREPVAQDIKDSSRIEEDADLILLCHRQWTHDETAPNIAEIIFAKARHAIKGTKVFFRFIDGHFIPTAQDMASNEMEAYKAKNQPVKYEKSSKLK